MPSFKEDFEWQKRFVAHYSEIATKAVRVDVSSDEDDWKRNTDFVLSVRVPLPNRDLRISARSRRFRYIRRYKGQFTIRLSRPSDIRTEMHKMLAGYGDFFIYGFESEPDSNRLYPWSIANLAMLRDYIASGGYYKTKPNRDGSSTFAVFYLSDMPAGFLLDNEGMPLVDRDAVWHKCHDCYSRYVEPFDDTFTPASGYWRHCMFCGTRWRSGWVAKATKPRTA